MRNAIIEIVVMKWTPTISAFVTFLTLGSGLFGFIWALCVALAVRLILNFFDKEIKKMSQAWRDKWDRRRKK